MIPSLPGSAPYSPITTPYPAPVNFCIRLSSEYMVSKSFFRPQRDAPFAEDAPQ